MSHEPSRPARWHHRLSAVNDVMTAEIRPRLLVHVPGQATADYELGALGVTIGRHESCDLALPSRYVSRRHARLEPSPAGWTLLDLSDTNPVTVNGIRPGGPYLLANGDQIQVADVVLEYVAPAADADATQVFQAAPPVAPAPTDTANRQALSGSERGLLRRVVGGRGTLTVMFTDLEESTRVTAEIGDVRAQEYLRTHNQLLRAEIDRFAGIEVKGFGDGFLIAFTSASAAAYCAIAIQRALAAHNRAAERPIVVRMGLNLGEVIAEDEDIFGTAVIVAARVMARAAGGEIYLSHLLTAVLDATGEFRTTPLGPVVLKGFERPQDLFRLEWQPPSPEGAGDAG